MEIKITCIGPTGLSFAKEGIRYYAGRIKHFCTFSIQELSDVKHAGSVSQEVRKELEGLLFQKHMVSGYVHVLLDAEGKLYDSPGFSRWIESKQLQGIKGIQFFIGGPYGFSDAFMKFVPERMSMSPFTYPHDLVRVVLCEQIYRAYTILGRLPYHH
jgi:23S rRNA (pseudouridine1915-N3)-methyltransferase